jgi:RNA polymerase sigma factor (sigma-70 family)
MGFEELRLHLWPLAQKQAPEASEDVLQKTCEIVFARIGTIKNPKAFLEFARQTMLTARRKVLRIKKTKKTTESAENPDDQKQPFVEVSLDELIGDIVSVDTSVEDMVLLREIWDCFQKAIEKFPDKNMGVVMRQTGIGGVLGKAEKDREIAERLHISPSSVTTLRNRGRDILKQDQEFLDCLGRETDSQ